MKKTLKVVQNVLIKICLAIKPYVNINTISLVIAIIAAFISYRSLDESVKQRESMYKPELFIGSEDYSVDISNLKHVRFFYRESDSSNQEAVKRPWYRLNNVGMGSALSVSVRFLFNAETMMDFFLQNELIGVKMKEGDAFLDTLVFQNDTITILKGGSIADWTVDYVLPLSQSKEQSIQYFPPSVLETIVRACLWVSSQREEESVIQFPVPFKLEYKDINGKRYVKNLEMSVSCWSGEMKNIVRCTIRAGLSQEDFLRELKESKEEL